MKKYYLFLSLLISTALIYSCYPYNQIIMENDSYKNEDKIYIDFLLYANPNKTSFGIIKKYKLVDIKFEKVYDNNVDTFKNVRMFISLKVPTDETLNNPVFFKIDNEIYKTNYKNIDNIIYTKKETEAVEDSTAINSFDNTTYSTVKKVRSEVKLNKLIIDKLLYGNNINIRIYINENAYDIPFSYTKHKTLKRFIEKSTNRK